LFSIQYFVRRCGIVIPTARSGIKRNDIGGYGDNKCIVITACKAIKHIVKVKSAGKPFGMTTL
jgi:hypothetical protein